MSQHPSLKINQKGKQHRSVLKRAERIKILEKIGKWKEGNSVFGLPKVKTLRFKIKKEKVEEAAKVEVESEEAAVEAKPEAKLGERAQTPKSKKEEKKV